MAQPSACSAPRPPYVWYRKGDSPCFTMLYLFITVSLFSYAGCFWGFRSAALWAVSHGKGRGTVTLRLWDTWRPAQRLSAAHRSQDTAVGYKHSYCGVLNCDTCWSVHCPDYTVSYPGCCNVIAVQSIYLLLYVFKCWWRRIHLSTADSTTSRGICLSARGNRKAGRGGFSLI